MHAIGNRGWQEFDPLLGDHMWENCHDAEAFVEALRVTNERLDREYTEAMNALHARDDLDYEDLVEESIKLEDRRRQGRPMNEPEAVVPVKMEYHYGDPVVYVVGDHMGGGGKHLGQFTTLAKAKAHVEEYVKFCLKNKFLKPGDWDWEDCGGEWLYGNGESGGYQLVCITRQSLDRGMKEGMWQRV